MKILAVDLGKVKSAARRTMIKNTIHAILDRQAISMPSGKRAWTNAGRKWLERQARAGDVPFAAHRGRSSRRCTFARAEARGSGVMQNRAR